MKSLTLMLVCLMAFLPPACGDDILGSPVNFVLNTVYREASMSMSSDGLSLYFHSDREGGHGNFDIWMVRRKSVTAPWEEPENLGISVNTNTGEYTPCISHDGLSLYFSSNRFGGSGGIDLYTSTRASTQHDWGKAVNLGGTVNSSWSEVSPSISTDGLQLFFSDDPGLTPRAGGLGDCDLWVSTRLSTSAPWGKPANLGQPVNSGAVEANPMLSPDGLMLFFSSDRPGGQGWDDIWVSTRSGLDGTWTTPKNPGPAINTTADEKYICISPDGRTLYLSSNRPGGKGMSDLWMIPVLSAEGFAALAGQ